MSTEPEPKPAQRLARRLAVHTMEHEGHMIVSLWVNDGEAVIGLNDMHPSATREELYREVGKIVVNQGLGKKQEWKP